MDTKSTVPVGASDQLLSTIKSELQNREVELGIEVTVSFCRQSHCK